MGWATDDRERPHHNYEVWHLAKKFVVQLYGLTEDFPDDEKYGLVAQLRQAAVSVPSNIAEGSARDTDAQFLRFLNHARGSLAEIDTQLELAGELGILDGLDVSDARRTFDRVSSALQSLINRIEADRRG